MKILLSLILAVIFFIPAKAEAVNYPKRIISVGPAITEELYLLGIGDRLVGCTVYCQSPPGAKDKEKIGTVINVDVERIAVLKPDLVIATSLTDTKAVKKLEKLKIRVITFPTARNFSQICDRFLELGKTVGREKEAGDIASRAEARVNLINERVKGLPKPKVFVQTGARPLYTANRASFVHDYIVRAGGINIAAGSRGGFDYGIYSREDVVKQNADVILIVDMGIVGEREKEIWQKYKSLNAVKNNSIYIIDSHRSCSPTPVSFAEMLEEIADLLHP